MNNINTPSQSPEDSASGLLGFQNLAMQKAMQNLDCCLPAKIITYDRLTNRASVEPQYQVTATSGDTTQMSLIEGIPVLLIGSNTAFISFDLKEGDLGWIIANDQDISLFLQSYQSSPGNTKRMHSFSDAFFIPDLMKDYYLSSLDETAIQTKEGTTYITISEGRIDLACGAVFTTVAEVDLTGEKDLTIAKGSLAKSGENYFRLIEAVTLDESGQGKGHFKSLVAGDIECPENTLTEIVTQVAGWNTVNNENKGEPQGESKGITITDQNIIINAPQIVVNGSTKIIGDVRVVGNITASGKIQDNVPE